MMLWVAAAGAAAGGATMGAGDWQAEQTVTVDVM